MAVSVATGGVREIYRGQFDPTIPFVRAVAQQVQRCFPNHRVDAEELVIDTTSEIWIGEDEEIDLRLVHPEDIDLIVSTYRSHTFDLRLRMGRIEAILPFERCRRHDNCTWQIAYGGNIEINNVTGDEHDQVFYGPLVV